MLPDPLTGSDLRRRADQTARRPGERRSCARRADRSRAKPSRSMRPSCTSTRRSGSRRRAARRSTISPATSSREVSGLRVQDFAVDAVQLDVENRNDLVTLHTVEVRRAENRVSAKGTYRVPRDLQTVRRRAPVDAQFALQVPKLESFGIKVKDATLTGRLERPGHAQADGPGAQRQRATSKAATFSSASSRPRSSRRKCRSRTTSPRSNNSPCNSTPPINSASPEKADVQRAVSLRGRAAPRHRRPRRASAAARALRREESAHRRAASRLGGQGRSGAGRAAACADARPHRAGSNFALDQRPLRQDRPHRNQARRRFTARVSRNRASCRLVSGSDQLQRRRSKSRKASCG